MIHISRNLLLSVKWPTSPKNLMTLKHGWPKINSNLTMTKQKLFSFPFRLPWNLQLFSSLTRLLSALATSPSLILPGTLDSFSTQTCPQRRICQTAYFELKCISSILRFFTEDAAKILVTSYILSQLDYCNCLLMGTPNSVIQPLQKNQNFAARLVLLAPCHHHSTPLLKKPLASHFRIYLKFKVACLCVNAMMLWFWFCLPLSTATHLHPVPYTTLFFSHLHTENQAIQTEDS